MGQTQREMAIDELLAVRKQLLDRVPNARRNATADMCVRIIDRRLAAIGYSAESHKEPATQGAATRSEPTTNAEAEAMAASIRELAIETHGLDDEKDARERWWAHLCREHRWLDNVRDVFERSFGAGAQSERDRRVVEESKNVGDFGTVDGKTPGQTIGATLIACAKPDPPIGEAEAHEFAARAVLRAFGPQMVREALERVRNASKNIDTHFHGQDDGVRYPHKATDAIEMFTDIIDAELAKLEGSKRAPTNSSKSAMLDRDSVLMMLSRIRERIEALAAFANATEVRGSAAQVVQDAINEILDAPKPVPKNIDQAVAVLNEMQRLPYPNSDHVHEPGSCSLCDKRLVEVAKLDHGKTPSPCACNLDTDPANWPRGAIVAQCKGCGKRGVRQDEGKSECGDYGTGDGESCR